MVTAESTSSRAAQRLAALIRIPTITDPRSSKHGASEAAAFAMFRAALHEFYPQVFGAASVTELRRDGLMLKLAGASSEKPVVLMAHQDVVPVADDWFAEGWDYPPFEGVIADGFVHGRGSLDDKATLVLMLEAIEQLLSQGWVPPHDMYLIMGADEEATGKCAQEAAGLLRKAGIKPFLVVDDGGAVATGTFPGVDFPLAVVGVAEKGTMSIELSVEGTGGHAATPPPRSAPGILAEAVIALERDPFPGSLHEVQLELITTVARHMKGPAAWGLRMARLLRWPLAAVLPRVSAEMAAVTRTTTAVTMLTGAPAPSVLATKATAVVNVRVAVGSKASAVVERIKDVVGPAITVTVVDTFPPSPVSPRGDDARWRLIKEAVAASYPQAMVVPYVMFGSSDSRHLADLSSGIYRFAPVHMDAAQRASMHGPNERVEVESLGRGIEFFTALLTSPIWTE